MSNRAPRGATKRQVERYLVRFGPARVATIAEYLTISPQLTRWALKQIGAVKDSGRPATWRLK